MNFAQSLPAAGPGIATAWPSAEPVHVISKVLSTKDSMILIMCLSLAAIRSPVDFKVLQCRSTIHFHFSSIFRCTRSQPWWKRHGRVPGCTFTNSHRTSSYKNAFLREQMPDFLHGFFKIYPTLCITWREKKMEELKQIKWNCHLSSTAVKFQCNIVK